jgi:hypothetical protein
MNHAMKEPDGMQSSPSMTEIPALLVAGGSCSHLCRMPRTTDVSAAPPHGDSAPASRRRGARTQETNR